MNESNLSKMPVELLNRIICAETPLEMLNLARPQFGNPLILSNISRMVISITDEPDLDAPRWEDIARTKSIPLDCLVCTPIQQCYRDSYETELPVLDQTSGGDVPMLRKTLVSDHKVIGYLDSPIYTDNLSDDRLRFFNMLGNLISVRLKASGTGVTTPSNMQDYFCFDLLEGKITETDLIQERLEYFNWDLMGKGFIHIISIRWLGSSDQPSVKMRMLADQISSRIQNCKVFVYGLEIKVLCSVESSILQEKNAVSTLVEILDKYDVSAGVSRPLDDLAYIVDFNLQAKKAAQIGRLVEPNRKLHFFDNISVYYALELACEKVNPEQFVHSSFRILKQYDQEHDTNLLESLCTYLMHNQSITEAAAALYVHRNTMNYRIAKITELTNLNLNDFGVSEHLSFSFCVEKFKSYWHPQIRPNGMSFLSPTEQMSD